MMTNLAKLRERVGEIVERREGCEAQPHACSRGVWMRVPPGHEGCCGPEYTYDACPACDGTGLSDEMRTMLARIDELEREVDEAGGREAGAQATARQLAGIVVRWAAWLQGRCGTCGGSGCVPDGPGPDASPEPCPACEELREETCALADRHQRKGATT